MLTAISSLGIKVVCVDSIIEKVEQQIEEDNYKFCLEKKSRLIRSFIILRLCNEIFQTIQDNKNVKLLFIITKAAKLSLLIKHYNFIYASFLKLSGLLSLNFLIINNNMADLIRLANEKTGEGKEVRSRILHKINDFKKLPNLEKLKTYFKKYNITTTNTIDTNFNVKLGLFIT